MAANNGDSSHESGDTATYEDLIAFEYECEETELEIGGPPTLPAPITTSPANVPRQSASKPPASRRCGPNAQR